MENDGVASTVEASSSWLVVLEDFVAQVCGWVWGWPLIGFILATGLFLTFALRWRHVANLKHAVKCMLAPDKGSHGEVSQFGALCTALSATIGTGNIVGVATAIGTGGPGALFWMELAALFGLATKYAEGLLAVKYREVRADGPVLGGPFYYIEKGLKGYFGLRNWKWLAILFAVFGMAAGLMGIGTIVQIHGITSAVQRFFDSAFNPADLSTGICLLGTSYSLPVIIAGGVVTGAVAMVILGGLKRIAAVSMVVVPFMAILYVVVVLVILFANASLIDDAFLVILEGAFNPSAVTGGAVGTLFIALQQGVARGIFSNEAGLGSEPIAAAAAQTNEPARQGLVSMVGVYVDTFMVCTMTGLAIVITGAWHPELGLKGVDITIEAFKRGLAFLGGGSDGVANFFLMTSLCFFAFTTMLGWCYYAEKCLEYLIGGDRPWAIKAFRYLYVGVIFIGPYLTVSVVWGFADAFNGLMAFPNLIALLLLSPVVWRTTKDYLARRARGEC